MQRYFFDVAARTYVQYDYHGRDIHKPEEARELAELIALDIECTDGDDLVGAEIQVVVIPGVRSRSPESMTTTGSMDSQGRDCAP